MLASPLYPTSSFSPRKSTEEPTQYRPAKDMEAFKNLLPPAVEFIEGSSSGTFILGEGKYEPINGSPKAKVEKPSLSPSFKSHRRSISNTPSNKTSLYTGTIDTSWPQQQRVGSGLNNTGNTCFLNSALQCLIYTPPLVRVLSSHQCKTKSQFCMACALKQTILDTRSKMHAFTPYLITTKLQTIAKHLRRGRQEDSHEFLRYAIDALQKSCLAGHPSKIDPKLAETTWVHKIFGGRLRSRVTCGECGFNSDTLDSILDLSIDIAGLHSLRDALRNFVAPDHLRGANKYKCEKCKKPVVAEKQFTIDEAPAVLTVHLKRFSPMGRKVGHPVKYDDKLILEPYMSKGKFGPAYSLYGVISHAGGGPNSGHYYAHIRDGTGQWHEMNDETVSRQSGAPLSMKNAYVLFYVREKGQALESAISLAEGQLQQRPTFRNGVAAGMKKRKATGNEDDREDTGIAATPSKARFIGPTMPSPSSSKSLVPDPNKKQKLDPQAKTLKEKIQAAKAGPSALQSLSQYDETDEEEEEAPSKEIAEKEKPPVPIPTPATVPPVNFYGGSSETKQRQAVEGNRTPFSPSTNRSPTNGGFKKRRGPSGTNPYSRLRGSNNLSKIQTYGRQKKRMII